MDESNVDHCFFCPQMIPSAHRDDHQQVYHPDLHFQCLHCARAHCHELSPLFVQYYDLMLHLKKSHHFHDNFQEAAILPRDGRVIECKLCERVFLSRGIEAVILHYDLGHVGKLAPPFTLSEAETRSFGQFFEMKCRFCSFETGEIGDWLGHFQEDYAQCVNFDYHAFGSTPSFYIDPTRKPLQPVKAGPHLARVPQLEAPKPTRTETPPGIRNSVKFCQPCDLHFKSRTSMHRHLRNVDHLARAEKAKVSCEMSFPHNSREMFVTAHLWSKAHLKGVKGSRERDVGSPPRPGRSSRPLKSPDKRVRNPRPGPSVPSRSHFGPPQPSSVPTVGASIRKYICNICNTHCPTAFALQQHFLGKIHLREMNRHPPGHRFKLMCSICFPTLINEERQGFFQHVEGRVHLDRLNFLNGMEQTKKRTKVVFELGKKAKRF